MVGEVNDLMPNRCIKCNTPTLSVLCTDCRLKERELAKELPAHRGGPTQLTLDRERRTRKLALLTRAESRRNRSEAAKKAGRKRKSKRRKNLRLR